jgi:hypothetical protein
MASDTAAMFDEAVASAAMVDTRGLGKLLFQTASFYFSSVQFARGEKLAPITIKLAKICARN